MLVVLRLLCRQSANHWVPLTACLVLREGGGQATGRQGVPLLPG